MPVNRGDRFMIVHEGTDQEFIDGVFYGTGKGDLHGDINSINFKKLLVEKQILGLLKNSVLIFGNSPYHIHQTEKFPTSNSTKSDLTQ